MVLSTVTFLGLGFAFSVLYSFCRVHVCDRRHTPCSHVTSTDCDGRHFAGEFRCRGSSMHICVLSAVQSSDSIIALQSWGDARHTATSRKLARPESLRSRLSLGKPSRTAVKADRAAGLGRFWARVVPLGRGDEACGRGGRPKISRRSPPDAVGDLLHFLQTIDWASQGMLFAYQTAS